MAGKAKFDQEAAFKSIIGADRKGTEAAPADNVKKNEGRVQRAYFWIGTLTRHCVEWRWRKEKI